MYSETIIPDIDQIWKELSETVRVIVSGTKTRQETAEKVTAYLSKAITNRSKAVLTDMISALNKEVFCSPEFSTAAAKLIYLNKNLTDEIKNKYSFTIETNIDYKEADKVLHYAVIPVGIGVVSGVGTQAVSAGVIKLAETFGRTLTPISPVIPVSVAIAGGLGAFLFELLYREPRCSRKKFLEATKEYLLDLQKQFCDWLDEAERYFYQRVEEIKQEIRGGQNGGKEIE